VEKETFGMSHDEAGGLLAERWSLPESLADAIRHHHVPEASSVNPALTDHVYLADLLMSRFAAGQELERICTQALRPRLERLGIQPDQFPVIVDRMPKSVFREGGEEQEEGAAAAREGEPAERPAGKVVNLRSPR
jgi:hypothetical protein